ncbi:hypothetical protein SFUMM280S_10694 [Streptomyces fumanus]
MPSAFCLRDRWSGNRRDSLDTLGLPSDRAPTRELTQEPDWLRGARIAWVARNGADAGWTVTDVKGWLHLRGEAARVRRGSGLLAGAETLRPGLPRPTRRPCPRWPAWTASRTTRWPKPARRSSSG